MLISLNSVRYLVTLRLVLRFKRICDLKLKVRLIYERFIIRKVTKKPLTNDLSITNTSNLTKLMIYCA